VKLPCNSVHAALLWLQGVALLLGLIERWNVRDLGNFSINLIQKKIKNKYVPSYILIIIILITEIIARVATAYPAAPEPTLVDIAAVNVAVPLNVVQMSCSADHHASRRHREVEEVADRSSNRVEDVPQKPDYRSSPEQMNS